MFASMKLFSVLGYLYKLSVSVIICVTFCPSDDVLSLAREMATVIFIKLVFLSVLPSFSIV